MYRWLTIVIGPGILLTYFGTLCLVAIVLVTYVDPIDTPGGPEVESVSWSQAVLITTDIATGGNPADYKQSLHTMPQLWGVAWAVRAAGWLIVPTVIGYMVSQLLLWMKQETARRKRVAIFAELADDQELSGKERERFIELGLELLQHHEDFLFGKKGNGAGGVT